MPVVVDDLSGLSLYGWAFSAFFLGSLVGIVYAGLQIDRHGLARPFALGLGLFACGLLVGGFAPAMPVLVLGRTIQGFGAAAVPTVAYVAIGRSYAEGVRPRMFATLSTAWVVPGLVGPALAGLVADHVGWRYVFLGLVPFVLLGAALVLPSLRPLAAVADEAETRADRRRLVDATRVACGAALLLATSSIGPNPLSLVALATGIAVGLPPLRRLVPPGTLSARRGLPTTILVRGAATFSFFGAEAYLPLALVAVRGTSVTEAGVALTAATLSWTLGSWIQARQMTRWGGPRLIRLGFVCITLGIAVMATVVLPSAPLGATVVAWGIGGLGMGLAYAPISMLVLRDAPPAEQGRATSSLQLSDVLGSALGTGLGGAVVALGEASGRDPAVAIGAAFLIAVAVASIGIALAGRLAPARRRTDPPHDRPEALVQS
jgi:MFS family permease